MRSFQLTTRESSSTPITSTCFIAPERMNWSAIDSPKTKPAHAAERSNAGQLPAPSFCCTNTAVAGIGMSGVTVPTMIMSRSVASSSAASSALLRRVGAPCRS